MPKKPRVGTLMDSQHIQGSEKILKSARPHFCHIFWSLWKEISSENSVLVVSEFLRLFVNILLPDGKYCLSVKESVYRNHFKCYYIQIKKDFLNSFLHFRTLHQIYHTLKKKLQTLFDPQITDCKKAGYLNA